MCRIELLYKLSFSLYYRCYVRDITVLSLLCNIMYHWIVVAMQLVSLYCRLYIMIVVVLSLACNILTWQSLICNFYHCIVISLQLLSLKCRYYVIFFTDRVGLTCYYVLLWKRGRWREKTKGVMILHKILKLLFNHH